jgi:hypothetical protein
VLFAAFHSLFALMFICCRYIFLTELVNTEEVTEHVSMNSVLQYLCLDYLVFLSSPLVPRLKYMHYLIFPMYATCTAYFFLLDIK